MLLRRVLYSLLLPSFWDIAIAQGNWSTSPFNPFSLPLAVKSPYINTWAPLGYNTTRSSALYDASPKVWSAIGDVRIQDVGWTAAILVDGKPYQLMGFPKAGRPWDDAIQQSFQFTPTRTLYVFHAGPVNITMTFMSPIEADDLVHQSMPFSYLFFDVNTIDGNAHDIRIYCDVTGQWITGDDGPDATWQINESSDFIYLQMDLASPIPYLEILDRPQDATLYYSIRKMDGLTWQIGPSADIRAAFANGTILNNTAEVGTHPIGIPHDVLGYSVQLGSVSSTSEPIVFAVVVIRDPVIQYTNRLARIEERSAYYWSQFASVHDVIENVLNRSTDALSAAIALDQKMLDDAVQISSNYADLLSLSARQAMGAVEYTLPKSNGAFNTSDVKAFMKDMGGIGSGGVNAVDVLYSAMPVYIYLNPNILGYLLSPLLEYQESPQYTNPYAAQDIGSHFPNATGNPSEHSQQVEHSASMLIMSLAHAQATGDGSLLNRHHGTLLKWADYLVNNTMNPGDQTTSISDGIRSINQTNLILKGIIGIGAMAKISEYDGLMDDKNKYDAIAKGYVQQWTGLSSGSDQMNLNFGSGSSGLLYNLYADRLLQLNLINESVYDLQTSFYRQQTSLRTYGIPLDSSNASSITRSDWMMFAAASVSDTTVRDTMISQVWKYAASNIDQNMPFPVSYDPNNASSKAGPNSPAQGAMFAPLALSVPLKSVKFSGGGNATTGASTGSSKIGVIVGATIGGLLGLMFMAALVFFFCRYRHRRQRGMCNSKDGYNSTERTERLPNSCRSPSVEAEYLRIAPYRYPSQAGDHDSAYLITTPDHTHRSGEAKLGGLVIDSKADRGNTITTDSQSETVRSHALPPSQQNEILLEMDNIRRELARFREERAAFGEPLPSYDEEIAAVLASRSSR